MVALLFDGYDSVCLRKTATYFTTGAMIRDAWRSLW